MFFNVWKPSLCLDPHDWLMPHHRQDSCKQRHVHRSSNIYFTAIVIWISWFYVNKLSWDLAVIFCRSTWYISSHLESCSDGRSLLMGGGGGGMQMQWVELLCALWTWPRCFHEMCQRSNGHVCKSAVISVFLQMLSYTQLFWTEKNLLPHAVPCSVTLTESVSSSKKKKKKEKMINYCIYIYLINVKGLFLFMCESCESKFFLFSSFFFDLQSA